MIARIANRVGEEWAATRAATIRVDESLEASRHIDSVGSRLPPMLSELGPGVATIATARTPSVAAIESRLGRPATSIRVISGSWTPAADRDLIGFGRVMLLWRRLLDPDDALWWVQSRPDGLTMTLEEAEQLLGLAAAVTVLEEDRGSDGTPRFLIGGPATRGRAGFAVHWDRAVLANERTCHTLSSQLERISEAVGHGIHFLELPPDGEVTPAWEAGVEHVCRRVGARWPGAMLGVYSCGPTALDNRDAGMKTAREVAGRTGVIDRLLCHRIADVRAFDDCRAALARCRRYRLAFECSLMVGGQDDRPTPYLESQGYVPHAFDLRVPAFVGGAGLPVALPLSSPRTLEDPRAGWWSQTTTTPERAFRSAIVSMLEGPAQRAYGRLVDALDRGRRAVYLDRLAREPSTVGEWHRYHVYNWAPPPLFVTRIVAFDAGDLARAQSPLRQMTDLALTAPVSTGRVILDEARASATMSVAPDLATQRQRQIDAHSYLAGGGREALTADSEALLAALPQDLGATLELGFGYGLTAARLAGRSTRYIGLDLQVEQARTFAQRGGRGAVGDIHALPFRDRSFDTVISDNVLEHASLPLVVLEEIHRVLAPTGAAYVLIPLDASTSEFQIRTHLWKADEPGLREAARVTGFCAEEITVLEYGRLGVYGCFPASAGRTCLLVLRPLSALAAAN